MLNAKKTAPERINQKTYENTKIVRDVLISSKNTLITLSVANTTTTLHNK